MLNSHRLIRSARVTIVLGIIPTIPYRDPSIDRSSIVDKDSSPILIVINGLLIPDHDGR